MSSKRFVICLDGDQCAEKPCKNGAMCLDSVGGYDCVCKSGFSGENCQQGQDGAYLLFGLLCQFFYHQVLFP